MQNLFICTLVFFYMATANAQNQPSGPFGGAFRHGNFATELLIEIKTSDGSDQVLFSSPDQNAYGIPTQDVVIDSDSIRFALQSDSYRYEFYGIVQQDSLRLTLSVDNRNFPFSLARHKAHENHQIVSSDVQFRSGELILYGTIHTPVHHNGKAIYLVTSSGNQDRSASRAEAQYLALQGFITFHTDKRGTGLSQGNWQEARIEELCADDMKAIAYLVEHNKLEYKNIGIKGSSQGASKVPYILSKMPELGFGIAVSCPASTLLESDLNYWKNRARDELQQEELVRAEHVQRSVFRYIAGTLSREELNKELEQVRNEEWMSSVWVPDLDSITTDKKLNYSPMPYFEQAKQPLLVIQGSSDEIIPINSLEIIKDLTESKNPRSEYIEIEQADHAMMFKGESDFPYWPSLHPDYRPAMLKWLNQLSLADK